MFSKMSFKWPNKIVRNIYIEGVSILQMLNLKIYYTRLMGKDSIMYDFLSYLRKNIILP